jgi:hypothetical protein
MTHAHSRKQEFRAAGMTQVVEHLLRKGKALSSNPRSTKNKEFVEERIIRMSPKLSMINYVYLYSSWSSVTPQW